MKILWVKSGGLLPLDHGGKIRSYQLATNLARDNEVALFTFCEPASGDPHNELKQIFSRVTCVPIAIPAQNSVGEYAAYARNLISQRPYSVTKYCQPHVASLLREHLLQESYDLILCDFVLTAGVIPWDLPGRRVLFTHNVEAQIWERHFQVARNPFWKAVCYREFLAFEKMERDYLCRSDHVLAVSETDRAFFANVVHESKISVVPTGVDVSYFRPGSDAEQSTSLVFTGSMDWLANEDGIIYFMNQILPRIREQVPDVTLQVVGRRPSSKLQEQAGRIPGVTVTGTVPDIRPYVANGCVYIVPLLVGGGTRLKIFEAMAMGKAVVSTSIGAEGLPVTHGENIVLADQPEDFARQVVALLRDRGKRDSLGRAARKLVESKYSWRFIGRELANTLRSVVEARPAGIRSPDRLEPAHL